MSRSENLAVGLSIFIIGLAKKVVIADGFAAFATPVFAAAQLGQAPTFLEAWGGALAYTLQIYFDFSGYSDMAIGLVAHARDPAADQFQLALQGPQHHRFLAPLAHDAVAIPARLPLYTRSAATGRAGARRYANLMITMLLGGLWHGAGWTFVIWGGLHGLYLIVNHAWRWLRGGPEGDRSFIEAWASRLLTFLAVVVGWVFFRADSFTAARTIIDGMAGLNGLVIPRAYEALLGVLAAPLRRIGWQFGADTPLFQGRSEVLWLGMLLAIVWLFPNTQEITSRYRPALNVSFEWTRRPWLLWRPNAACLVAIAVLALSSLLSLTKVSVFLYFQF